MTNPLARIRQSGSYIAGLLIGGSFVMGTFAAIVTDASGWQSYLLYGTPVLLALGFALQILVTAQPRRPQVTSPACKVFTRASATTVKVPSLPQPHPWRPRFAAHMP